MQGPTAELTLGEASDRLDRLPASGFHARILIVAALSLLFDTLDTAVTGFVLASLRTSWHFDAKTIGVVSAIGLSGYLVGSAICGFIADHFGRKKTVTPPKIIISVGNRECPNSVPNEATEANESTIAYLRSSHSTTYPPSIYPGIAAE